MFVLVVDGSGDGQQTLEAFLPCLSGLLVGCYKINLARSVHYGEATAMDQALAARAARYIAEEAALPRPHLVDLYQINCTPNNSINLQPILTQFISTSCGLQSYSLKINPNEQKKKQ